ncbi:unnamed protein product [Adineta steineri]|uniref:Transmembrane protein 45B-like protein n=1 Tax=Adineta steineri TaxID=433720 RepID=A0A818QHA1_9BILA|nr:unnamed protein product [Adineta steineri]CAF3635100.1 unnamed protein product [Adineta steineri]
MGTWIGHVSAGMFFILFAIWWHINNCIRYLKSLTNETDEKISQQVKFRGSTTYSCNCLPSKILRQLPIESMLKILITSIHFSLEISTGYRKDPMPRIEEENAHHTAMLFGFFLGSWIEILVHFKVPLPKRTTQVMGFLAFAIESVMMVFHLHARNVMDAHIHKLLGLTMICSMISALGECFNPNNFWLIITRSFFALTQGTWFIQAAYVLWPQTNNPLFIWDPQSHRSLSLLTMSYAYHLAGNAFLLIISYLLVYMSTSSRRKLIHYEIDDDEIMSDYKLISNVNDEDNCI